MEETMKKKYARVVFEEEISESATEEEVEEIMRNVIRNFEVNRQSIDDIEIHEKPYAQNECDNDKIEEEQEHKKISVDTHPSVAGGIEIMEGLDLEYICQQCNLPLFSVKVFYCKEMQTMLFTYYEGKILYSHVNIKDDVSELNR